MSMDGLEEEAPARVKPALVGGMLLVKGGARDANGKQAALLRFCARTVLARASSRLAEVKLGAAVLSSGDFAA